MKKPGKSNFFSYLFMFLCVAVGVCCIFVAILMYSPKTEIFGLSYIKSSTVNNEIYYIQDEVVGKYQNITASNINIKTGYFNVRFCNSQNVPSFTIALEGTVNGLAHNAKIKEIGFTTKSENGTFYIESVEPDLFLPFSKNVDLVIYLPMPSAGSAQYPISSKNVTIETISGAVDLNNSSDSYHFNKLEVNTVSAKVDLGSNFNCESGEVTISGDNPSVEIYSNIAGMLTISAKNKARIKVGKINGSLDINAGFTEAKIGTVGGTLSYASNGGYIDVEQVGSVNCVGEKASYANLTIGEVVGETLISKGDASTIKIGKANGEVKITSTKGSVTVSNIMAYATIKTESGKINATFNTVYGDKSSLTSNYGLITANFEKPAYVDINQTNKGNIEVNVKNNIQFILNYFTNRGIKIFGETTNNNIKTGEDVKVSFNNAQEGAKVININNNHSDIQGDYNGYITINNGFEMKAD